MATTVLNTNWVGAISADAISIGDTSDGWGYTTDATSNTWGTTITWPHAFQLREMPDGELIAELTQRKEDKDMKGLFHVVVVDYKAEEVLSDKLVIAKDAKTAEIKALAPFANSHELDDLDVICFKMGDVRKKAEVQKVEVVKGE